MKSIRGYCGKVSSRGPSLYLWCPFLGGLAQSRNAPISFVMSFCLSVCLSFRLSAGISAAIGGWFFAKIYSGCFNKICWEISNLVI